jgi:hypothetical protein
MLEGKRLWLGDSLQLSIGETYRNKISEYFKG